MGRLKCREVWGAPSPATQEPHVEVADATDAADAAQAPSSLEIRGPSNTGQGDGDAGGWRDGEMLVTDFRPPNHIQLLDLLVLNGFHMLSISFHMFSIFSWFFLTFQRIQTVGQMGDV